MTSERVAIESRRFGTVEVDADQLLRLDGLPGFSGLQHFVVLDHDRASPFGWLLSVESPEVAFLVVDPRCFFPDYRPALEPGHLRAVDAASGEEVELLAIARVRGEEVSLNLAAPLVVNPRNRRAVQAILEGDRWSVREPLRPLPAS